MTYYIRQVKDHSGVLVFQLIHARKRKPNVVLYTNKLLVAVQRFANEKHGLEKYECVYESSIKTLSRLERVYLWLTKQKRRIMDSLNFLFRVS